MQTDREWGWTPRELHLISTARLTRTRLRSTEIRLLVLDLLEQRDGEALTCDEIYRFLTTAGCPANLSSVYRNVRMLADAGVLVQGNPKQKLRRCGTFTLASTPSTT